MNPPANRLIVNTAWLYGKIVVNLVVLLLTTRIILHGLGQTDYGIFNIVGGAIAMLGFLNSAMAQTTQRFLNYCEGQGDSFKLKQIYNVSIILHIIVACLVGSVLVIVGYCFFEDIVNIPLPRLFASKVVYACLVVSTVVTVLSSPFEAVINSHENFKLFALISILENLLKLLAAVACLFASQDKLIVYGLLIGSIPFLTLAIKFFYCQRHYSECIFRPTTYYSPSVIREMSSFMGWNLLGVTSYLVGYHGQSVVLNQFFGVLVNAAQGVSAQVGSAYTTLSNHALKVISPVLTKSEGENNRERVYYYTLVGCRIPYMLAVAIAIPIFLLSSEILDLWLVDVPLWTLVFLRLQIIRHLVDLMFKNLSTTIYAQGNIRLFSFVSSFLYLLPLIVSALFFHYGYPPYFLYLVWIVAALLQGFSALYFCHKSTGLPVRVFMVEVFATCIFLTVISLIPYYLMQHVSDTIACRVVATALSTILFILLGWRFILKDAERQAFRQFVIRFVSQKS